MISAWNTLNILYYQSFLFRHACYFNFITLFIFLIEELFNLSNYGINIILFSNNMSAREKHFDIHLWRIKSVHFLSQDGKKASYEGSDWMERLFISRQSRHSDIDVLI